MCTAAWLGNLHFLYLDKVPESQSPWSVLGHSP